MEKKINLLFLVKSFGMGGVEKANIYMINQISKEKFNIFVLYINEGMLMEDLNTENIIIQKLGDKIELKSFYTVMYIAKVISYIKKNKIEIVHTIDPTFYMIGSVAAHFSKIRHIRTQPNFIRRHEKLNTKTLKMLPFEKWTNKFITYNYASNKDLQLAGVDSNKIETIYSFEKPEEVPLFNDIRVEFDIPKNSKVILALHRMVLLKGYETFIEMIPFIIKEYQDVCFLLVGDGPLRPELESRVEELNIREFVRFTGFRKDIVNIIRQVDFGVYPLADTAAMGDLLLEGKVLITKKNGAMDEYIEHNVNGFLTPDDMPETYANYSLRLLKDEQLLENMERNRREFNLKYNDNDKNLQKLEKIISSVVTGINI
ncbi:glycosyltransferase [Rummeliibacillus pycnus]|uniref:glycosyltransferase n=1 Tax=Rummeliibacillus pycnus TaxID=101070 RepID=UPI003D2ABE0B